MNGAILGSVRFFRFPFRFIFRFSEKEISKKTRLD